MMVIIMLAFYSAGVSAEEQYNAPGPEGSIYSYDENDMPEVFFFPKDKARWDGSKVTMKEWYLLTDLQKQRFITEYMEKLKKQYDGALEVMGLDYLRALNLFSVYSNDKTINMPSTRIIDKMLSGQGKINIKGAN